MDGIVGKTYQTYNYLHPCQEIDICHKLSQSENFVTKYPSSVAAILKFRFRDRPRDPDFPVDPDFGPGPVIQLGLGLCSGRKASEWRNQGRRRSGGIATD